MLKKNLEASKCNFTFSMPLHRWNAHQKLDLQLSRFRTHPSLPRGSKFASATYKFTPVCVHWIIKIHVNFLLLNYNLLLSLLLLLWLAFWNQFWKKLNLQRYKMYNYLMECGKLNASSLKYINGNFKAYLCTKTACKFITKHNNHNCKRNERVFFLLSFRTFRKKALTDTWESV